MARLVIVSNRVVIPSGLQQVGGLAVALQEALDRNGGLWFGWSGEKTPSPGDDPARTVIDGVEYATLDLSPQEHAKFYLGFANATLWPLFHYRLGLIEYRNDQLRSYLDVNERFARALMTFLSPEDTIWIHDYHFLPLAESLRRLGARNPIGFFLHVPFPAPEILYALPCHEALTSALVSYDLIGFQTESDRDAFERCAIRLPGGRRLGDGLIAIGSSVSQTGVFPVGIDVDEFAGWARAAETTHDTRLLVDSLIGRRLIIGVDRLDYSKGIPKRFEAFLELLDTRPEHHRRATFLQIAPISRGEVAQYRVLRREIESLAGRINGTYAEADWVPIRYLNKPMARNVLAGFYRHASVGVVTPLRDGMNLVAKEYVAAQDPDDPGALVLSRFAGAAQELDAALLVNPFDVEAVAAAIHRGILMPLEERRDRWTAMMAVLGRTTQSDWSTRFLSALAKIHRGGSVSETSPPVRP